MYAGTATLAALLVGGLFTCLEGRSYSRFVPLLSGWVWASCCRRRSV